VAGKRVLFREAEDRWRNPGRVVLNWSNDPVHDLEMLTEKYRAVAHDRVAVLRAQRRGIQGSDCFEAYPIVFLYRQAFELVLKSIVLAGAVLLREEGDEPMPIQKMKHQLTPLFAEVCRIFGKFGGGKDDPWNLKVDGLRTYDDFEAIVREFDEVDSGSYAFRYSMKTDGSTASVDPGFEFDLFAFAETMDTVLLRLTGVPEWIRDVMQDRWEAAYERRQEEWAYADPADYEPDYS